MAYVTTQDLIDRFGEAEIVQLGDRNGDGVIDADVITRAIGDAGAEIDAALAARYALPLADVPPLLTAIAADLVRYRLYVDAAPERVRDAANDARRLLARLATGDAALGLPLASQPSVAALPRVSARDAIFSPTEGF